MICTPALIKIQTFIFSPNIFSFCCCQAIFQNHKVWQKQFYFPLIRMMWSTCSVAKLRSILDICNANLHTCSRCVTAVSRVTSLVTQRVTCNVLIFRIKSADSNLLRDSNQWGDGYCGYSDILQCCRYWPPPAAHCRFHSAAAGNISISFNI